MDDGPAPLTGGARLVESAAIARRVRNVAVWSIALFIAFVPAAMIGGERGDDPSDSVMAGRVLAMMFGVAGLVVSVLAFTLAFRHWDILSSGTRWLASLPLLVIVFLLALSMLLVTIV